MDIGRGAGGGEPVPTRYERSDFCPVPRAVVIVEGMVAFVLAEALLEKNPRCCFEVDICDRIIRDNRPCSWGMGYRSVIGYGKAAVLTDPAEKKHGLNCIMRHYGGGSCEFSEHDIGSVTVIRITIDSMTGKKHQ